MFDVRHLKIPAASLLIALSVTACGNREDNAASTADTAASNAQTEASASSSARKPQPTLGGETPSETDSPSPSTQSSGKDSEWNVMGLNFGAVKSWPEVTVQGELISLKGASTKIACRGMGQPQFCTSPASSPYWKDGQGNPQNFVDLKDPGKNGGLSDSGQMWQQPMTDIQPNQVAVFSDGSKLGWDGTNIYLFSGQSCVPTSAIKPSDTAETPTAGNTPPAGICD